MNRLLKRIIKYSLFPVYLIYRECKNKYYQNLAEKQPQKLAAILYKRANGRKLNWENPQDLSEKINWMKFHCNLSKWTELADKYLVRKYVESKGLEDILVKLYGVWKTPEEIDFDKLPKSFVLKTNNSCGTVLLVKDKSNLNIEETRKTLNIWLRKKLGKETVEPHYLDIDPLIIAEEYLDMGNDLVDYKLHVVHGVTELVMVCSNRKIGKSADICLYDKDWNFRNDLLGTCHKYDNVLPIECPKTFEKMKEYARILCQDFPFVRMDFYEVNGKVYFGEMTFTPKGGYCNTLTYAEQLRIGKLMKLPKALK